MKRKFYIIPMLRDLPESELYPALADIGFAGVEAFSGKLTKERFDQLASYGLELIHGGLPYAEDGTVDEDYVALLKEHHIDDVAMMKMTSGGFHFQMPDPNDPNYRYYGMPGMGTYDQVMEAVDQWNREAEIAARYGFKIHHHNHTHEFRTANFEYLMDIFLRNTAENVVMELDVGWALVAGVDVISWIRKWAGRIGSLHVKAACWALGPEGNGHMCPLPPYDKLGYSYREFQAREDFAKAPQGPMAQSIVDWTEVFRAAEAGGCTTFILERERYYKDNALDCLREDYAHIRKCLDALD